MPYADTLLCPSSWPRPAFHHCLCYNATGPLVSVSVLTGCELRWAGIEAYFSAAGISYANHCSLNASEEITVGVARVQVSGAPALA